MQFINSPELGVKLKQTSLINKIHQTAKFFSIMKIPKLRRDSIVVSFQFH